MKTLSRIGVVLAALSMSVLVINFNNTRVEIPVVANYYSDPKKSSSQNGYNGIKYLTFFNCKNWHYKQFSVTVKYSIHLKGEAIGFVLHTYFHQNSCKSCLT